MLFNSIEFLFFLPIVVIIYYILPFKYRTITMLLASYFFYMCWKAEYIVLILISTFIDYFVALNIEKTSNQSKRKQLLYLSIFVNLGILFFFKYANFFGSSVNNILSFLNVNEQLPVLKLLLPVGISFYTFQTMSYTIDVYKGELKAEKSFIQFALFVTYWPQLVAGPIERAGHLLKQFKRKVEFSYENISMGFRLILWGFFKKIVIADRLSSIVSEAYNNNPNNNAWIYWVGTLFFAFQIYCDFSAYSDIAIGSAKMMGIKLMENFKQPYFSKSISEFWKRWHISLSTWFRDYVYIPLGGNRVVKWRWYYNLFITFLVSGIWHGANWTFVFWGALHGSYLILAILKDNFLKNKPKLSKIENYKPLALFSTFMLVLVGWIFFRSENLEQAFTIFKSIASFKNYEVTIFFINNKIELLLSTLFLTILLYLDFIHQSFENMASYLQTKNVWYRWSLYYSLILLIIIFGVYGKEEFIYFQF